MALNAKSDQTYSPRRINGKFAPGVSGNPGGDGGRARRALNTATIREMHLAFNKGGKKAIEKVMNENPAVFLKLLVLLVPREMKVEHAGGVKAMSDEQLEAGIEAITAMLEARLPGDRAKVVDGEVMPDAPALPGPRKARRKVGRDDNNVGMDVGTDDNTPNS